MSHIITSSFLVGLCDCFITAGDLHIVFASRTVHHCVERSLTYAEVMNPKLNPKSYFQCKYITVGAHAMDLPDSLIFLHFQSIQILLYDNDGNFSKMEKIHFNM